MNLFTSAYWFSVFLNASLNNMSTPTKELIDKRVACSCEYFMSEL